jgi:AraC-like DNA-binding protein
MIEVEYYVSVSRKSQLHLAEALAVACGSEILVRGNQFLLPKELGTGKFVFYELEEGLSLNLIDCVFDQDIIFKRPAVLGNEYYNLHFNLSTGPVIASKASGRVVDLGSDWKTAVLLSSSGKGVEIAISSRDPVRSVSVVYTRSWFMKHFSTAELPMTGAYVKNFVEDIPTQLTINLDLHMLAVAEDIFTANLPDYGMPLFLAGAARKLVALFTERLLGSDEKPEESMQFREVMQIMKATEQAERSLQETIPSLDSMADICFMSRSKFATLFRKIFQKNFGDYFLEKKMQHAAELLLKGFPVIDVAHGVGYSNVSHFSKAFNDYFRTTPKIYQLGAKLQKTIKKKQ